MIYFVNAKINIGLQIGDTRPDGYHNLRTVFYPVGLYAGTPSNPEPFCDILEISPVSGDSESRCGISFGGRPVDCPPEKNLVTRAADLYMSRHASPGFSARIFLDKHLPDGAGMGGGSADAAFTFMALARADRGDAWIENNRGMMAAELAALGADCPFFAYNRPMYAEGIGDELQDVDIDLSGNWLVAVKPDLNISTKEAFAGVVPGDNAFDLRKLADIPLQEWREVAVNDFERSLFPNHPVLRHIKEELYGSGAAYSSLTGSGSVVFGIYTDRENAAGAAASIVKNPTMQAVYLLKL